MTLIHPVQLSFQRLGRWGLTLLLPLAVCAGVHPPAARADNIDVELFKKAPNLVKILATKHCKNVGVLRFQVAKDAPRHSFSTTQLSSNLAARLENALLLQSEGDEVKAIRIIRDAGRVAAARHISVSDRSKLFSIADYPLAWGTEKVKADAFLTGLVKLSADLQKTTVQIVLFTSRNPARAEKIADFTVPTDRSILHDLGETFALARSLRKRSASENDRYAVQDAFQRDNNQPTGERIAPDNVFGFRVKVLYDGVEQAITQDSISAGEWRVATPQPNQKIMIRLIPQLTEQMGWVLKVNGESTLERERDEPSRCRRWILGPASNGSNQDHEGFYTYGGTARLAPFRALSPEESISREGEFDDRYVGTIRLDVFDQRGETVPPETMTVSLRGGSRAVKQHPATFQALKSRMMSDNRLKLGTRGLIVADPETPTERIQTKQFPNARHLGGITIRYYDPQRSKMKVSNN